MDGILRVEIVKVGLNVVELFLRPDESAEVIAERILDRDGCHKRIIVVVKSLVAISRSVAIFCNRFLGL